MNKSTVAGLYPVCERRQAENHIKDRSKPYQYNYRAETLDYANVMEPIDQPRKFHISRTTTASAAEIAAIQKKDRLQSGHFKRNQEMPVHPKLENVASWNSNVTPSPKEREQTLMRMTLKSRAATAKMAKRVGSSQAYKTPYQQSEQISTEVRELKRTGNFNIEEDHTHHHAKVEQQKISVKNRNAVESNRKFKTNHHSGVWEFNKTEGRYMWSDTGSFVYESKGGYTENTQP